ncbi:hypothetical protein LLG96_05870 [bacterium]|nr:hypothetical protein [bacterium]
MPNLFRHLFLLVESLFIRRSTTPDLFCFGIYSCYWNHYLSAGAIPRIYFVSASIPAGGIIIYPPEQYPGFI